MCVCCDSSAVCTHSCNQKNIDPQAIHLLFLDTMVPIRPKSIAITRNTHVLGVFCLILTCVYCTYMYVHVYVASSL